MKWDTEAFSVIKYINIYRGVLKALFGVFLCGKFAFIATWVDKKLCMTLNSNKWGRVLDLRPCKASIKPFTALSHSQAFILLHYTVGVLVCLLTCSYHLLINSVKPYDKMCFMLRDLTIHVFKNKLLKALKCFRATKNISNEGVKYWH